MAGKYIEKLFGMKSVYPHVDLSELVGNLTSDNTKVDSQKPPVVAIFSGDGWVVNLFLLNHSVAGWVAKFEAAIFEDRQQKAYTTEKFFSTMYAQANETDALHECVLRLGNKINPGGGQLVALIDQPIMSPWQPIVDNLGNMLSEVANFAVTGRKPAQKAKAPEAKKVEPEAPAEPAAAPEGATVPGLLDAIKQKIGDDVKPAAEPVKKKVGRPRKKKDPETD